MLVAAVEFAGLGIGQFLDMRMVEGGQVVGFRLSRAFDCKFLSYNAEIQ